MTVGIIGLGLIGASLAATIHENTHDTVLGRDINENTMRAALGQGTVDGALTDQNTHVCDLILIALYPRAAVQVLGEIAPHIRRGTIVMDCCGIKRPICAEGKKLSAQYGFTFVGGHPMAGTHNSGYKYAKATLFKGAPMVLVPPVFDDMQLLERVKEALSPCGFGSFSVCSAKEHDRLITFTSQMPHVLSNAYIKSPTAGSHKGFSAGSYKDLTRVAWLNSKMWAELCMENRENMLFELNTYIENLNAYKKALQSQDIAALTALLEEGRKRKEEVDG